MTIPPRKYPGFSNFLKNKREIKYRSAREFAAQNELGISYPQYSRYESGDQLPGMEPALTIARALEIPAAEMLLEWALAQVDAKDFAPECKNFERWLEEVRQRHAEPAKPGALSEAPAQASRGPSVGLDHVIVFNRSHLKLFSSDPLFRDVFTYVNAFGTDWIEETAVAKALKLELTRAQQMLSQLADLGVINYENAKCQAMKKIFYFPDDEDFFALRNFNFAHNTQDILKKIDYSAIRDKQAYRGLITREMAPEQVHWTVGQLEGLLGRVTQLPEVEQADGVYSVCLMVGERFKR